MVSSLFTDYVHEKGDVCFNPELPPVFDDDLNVVIKGHDEVQSFTTMFPIDTHMEVHFKPSPVLRDRGKRFHLPLRCCVDSRTVISWLYGVECSFESIHIYVKRKSELVVSCLRNNALLWFNDITPPNKNSVMSKMKHERRLRSVVKNNFITKSFMLDLKTKLEKVNQGGILKRINLYSSLYSEIACWINIEANESSNVMCVLAMYAEKLINGVKVYAKYFSKTSDLLVAITYDLKGKLGGVLVESIGATSMKPEESIVSGTSLMTELSFGICETVQRRESGHWAQDYIPELHSKFKDYSEEGESKEMLFKYGIGAIPSTYFSNNEVICDILSLSVGHNSEITKQKPICDRPFSWLTHFNNSIVPQNLKSFTFELVYHQRELLRGPFEYSECNASDIHVLDVRKEPKRVRSKGVELIYLKVCYSLGFGCGVLVVAVITPRYIMLVFDPGGIDNEPPLKLQLSKGAKFYVYNLLWLGTNELKAKMMVHRSFILILFIKFEVKFFQVGGFAVGATR